MDYPQKRRYDRVKETTYTTGTGAYLCGGAPVGARTFSSTVYDQEIFDYGVTEAGGPGWENGIGRYNTATNTVTRVHIYDSSNNNQPVNWGAEFKSIFLTVNAQSLTDIQDDVILGSLILG